jgi:hypothetical protein
VKRNYGRNNCLTLIQGKLGYENSPHAKEGKIASIPVTYTSFRQERWEQCGWCLWLNDMKP